MATNEVFQRLQTQHKSLIQSSFNSIIKEMNESLNRMLATIVNHAEYLEQSIVFETNSAMTSLSMQDGTMVSNNISTNFINSNLSGQLQIEPKFNTSDISPQLYPNEIKDEIKEEFHPNREKTNISYNENSNQILSNNHPFNVNNKPDFNLNNFKGPDSTFKCELCTYSTKDTRNFARHVKGVHEGIKEFRCTECSYASAHKRNVIRHQNSHAQSGNVMNNQI